MDNNTREQREKELLGPQYIKEKGPSTAQKMLEGVLTKAGGLFPKGIRYPDSMVKKPGLYGVGDPRRDIQRPKLYGIPDPDKMRDYMSGTNRGSINRIPLFGKPNQTGTNYAPMISSVRNPVPKLPLPAQNDSPISRYAKSNVPSVKRLRVI